MGQVLVIRLDGAGESRELTAGGLTVGRAEDNDWILSDTASPPVLSRRHCRFDIGSRGPTVTDLGSTNGTSVNGQPIVPHKAAPLRGGETIEIGLCRLSVDVVDSDARPRNLGPPGTPGGVPRSLGVPRPARSPSDTRIHAEPHEPTDPLAGAFSEKLPPLQRNRKTTPFEGEKVDGAPHLEAIVPRRPPAPKDGMHDPLASLKAPVAPPKQKAQAPSSPASDPPARPAPEDDPFGLGGLERATSAPAKSVTPSPPPRAEKPVPGNGPPADDLRAAFLTGAGVPQAVADDRSAEQFLTDAGRMFAKMAEGLRELLAVRAIIKDQAGLDSTRISATLNNPLKLSATGREATTVLLSKPEAGYLAPLPAIEAGFRDLKAHELAVLEGVQSAVDELLDLFSPETLEHKLDRSRLLENLLQGGRRARLWELYQDHYEEIAKAARSRFMGRMNEAFRAGYTRKAKEVAGAKVMQP